MTDKSSIYEEDFLVIEALPFITGVHAAEAFPKELKPYLPFRLRFRPDNGLIVQDSSLEVDTQLKYAYQKGSMLSTPLGEGSLNASLADEIIQFVDLSCGGLKNKTFIEPGCGTGFLLKKLFDSGAKKVVGCEPGPQGRQSVGSKYEFIIHNCFLNELDVHENFDCIYHYGVLEHIKEPEVFLRQSMDLLRPAGTFFAAVPGCRQDMELGNFMILAHEHYNYFTERSLKQLFAKVGLQEIEVREFRYSKGIICAWGKKPSVPVRREFGISQEDIEQERALMKLFIQKAKSHLSSLQTRIERIEDGGKSIGLYGAPKSLAGLLRFKNPPRNFDGDTYKHGYYFSGSSYPIEPPDNLRKRPVDELWILPIHHDRAISEYLKKEILPYQDMNIFSLLEFMRNYV
jgi:SAM-dependent methyltransferase